MDKGIIYVMTTIVPGLIKIGKTGSNSFEQRMYNLEHDGYRNVTALKRAFAIEVDDYSDKETLLHTIFEKSRVSDTELFAVDVNIVIQLLSSFEGKVVYPKNESKEEIFGEATDTIEGKVIPDGIYTFNRKKKSENRTITAKAAVKDGSWTLLAGSVLAIKEDAGGGRKAKAVRNTLPTDASGKLLEDAELGNQAPSYVGVVVMNQAVDGWIEWKNSDGDPIDIYRKSKGDE